MTPIELLSAEMAYVSFHDSCQDPCVDGTGWLRECRRLRGHDGQHASDFPLYMWGMG